MSDPFRDAAAKKRSRRKEKVRETHTPIVLWVKTPEDKDAREIRKWLHEQVNSLPYVRANSKDAPYPYATDGCLREEDADGGGE